MKRRDFLAASIAALTVPRFALAQASAQFSGYGRLLILVELKGGNDGLNTVVPYADAAYYSLRPRLAIARDQVLQIDERTGLHPALKPLLPLWQARELAVVQGVGYANPNLSHFRSIEIWDTASASEQYLAEGWLARCFAAAPPPVAFAADGVVVGSNDMGPLAGTGARVLALNDPAQFQRQARLANPSGAAPRNAALAHILKIESDIAAAASHLETDVEFRTEFPKGPFGNAVRTAAQLAANGAGVAAIRLSLGGFDTHQNQAGTQARLLGEFAEGMAALKGALVEKGRWDSTLIFTYAEFGRRPKENDTSGTDHGTAAAHFVAGGKVRGGLYGDAPRLDALEGGNLRFAVDFRNIYATAIDGWWGLDSSRALNGRFKPLGLLKQM
ncbi:MAG TPA: DUF1501 domain-containing protein [Burkholderiales bacterium]|nr:DUF1501 domain-containing protein [Burkholderiales bacterium]